MIGTLTNCATIFLGSVVGSIFKKGLKDTYKDTMMQGLGLAALGLGIYNVSSNLSKSAYPVLFIFSMAAGGLLGELFQIEKGFDFAAQRCSKGSRLAEGLSTAVLLYCIGTFSILGPIKSALNGDNTLLFTNAMLDGVTSIILAASFGIGIALSAVVLFLWQGSIYLCAGYISPFMTPELLTELSIVGGVLIISSSLSILEIKKCKTLNLLPALLIPPIFFLLKNLLGL
jgi:uncharacterized membrane protein YqgA involved in biofilm formation